MKGMRSCKEIAELLSRRLDEPLGLLERAELGLHLRMCGDCREVERQLGQVHAWSAELLGDGLDAEPPARRAE